MDLVAPKDTPEAPPGGVRTATRRTWLGLAGVVSVLFLHGGQAAQAAAANPAEPIELPPELQALLPQLVKIVDLAAIDPALAASLLPDGWIDAFVAAVHTVDDERPRVHGLSKLALRNGAVGPWSSVEQLAGTIDALDAVSVASLYRAAEPRVAQRASLAKRASKERRHFRDSLGCAARRLADSAVVSSALGTPALPLTPTQLELAKLGPRVARSTEQKVRSASRQLWGRAAPPACTSAR